MLKPHFAGIMEFKWITCFAVFPLGEHWNLILPRWWSEYVQGAYWPDMEKNNKFLIFVFLRRSHGGFGTGNGSSQSKACPPMPTMGHSKAAQLWVSSLSSEDGSIWATCQELLKAPHQTYKTKFSFKQFQKMLCQIFCHLWTGKKKNLTEWENSILAVIKLDNADLMALDLN